MALSIFLPFLFLLITTTCNAIDSSCKSSQSDGSDLSVLHIYGKCSPFTPPMPTSSWFDTVLEMITKDADRVTYLSTIQGQKTKVPIASGQQVLQTGNYVLRAKLGTPGQLMFMVLDTGNDAAWVPCAGCLGCSTTQFSPANSSTYIPLDCTSPQCPQARGPQCTAGPVPCVFNQSYGGDSSFAATLSQDTLRLALDVVPTYVFGCINTVAGGAVPRQGLLGLGRGPMSLLSQTGSLYQGIFSYCLPSFKSYYFSGSLKLGPTGQPKNIKTTPLLRNPHRSSLYYVNLTGISVGKKLVAVPQEYLTFDPTTGAGTIFDSGTVITRFINPVYSAVRDEFRAQVNGTVSSLGAFDTCFPTPMDGMFPPITLHFTELDLPLPMENALIHSSAGTLACLAMAAAPDNVNSVLNVIANLQQQNHRIVFDLTNSRLGIGRELCN